MLITVLAFAIALGVLIAVHEYGHYRMAVACGVKVLRFSIGFGKVLWRWQPQNSPTEFVLAAIPLGGYVKMLDEREAPVPPEELHLAFNTRPLWARASIVAAGPLANLLLAVVLYSALNWWGTQEVHAVLARPTANSMAQAAGIQEGVTVHQAALQGDSLAPIASFDDLNWLLTQGALDKRDLHLELITPGNRSTLNVMLPLSQLQTTEVDQQMFRRIGLAPWVRPELGEIMPTGAAARAGLQTGDLVMQIDDEPVTNGAQLRELILASAQQGSVAPQTWQVQRSGQTLRLHVTPELTPDAQGRMVARIEAYVGVLPTVTVQRGLFDGLWAGAAKTWETSALSVRLMGRLIMGQISIKNISGPLTIADYAGKSAQHGFVPYLLFIAFISVSLGVLNLMPVPVLDGGHLLYYLWEALTGKAVSDAWMERLQRGGIAVLLLMMSIALFNDITRFFG